jgi:RNA polymerase sigma factor (sigma-70 family)
MSESADNELLEQFVRNESEAAFAMLVQRHIALVYSVALRHTANPEHAQDITQAVFIILARKAGGLGRRTVVPGWLYHTARLTAANFQRAEARRIRREHEVFMQSTLETTAPEAVWRELSPQLDEAMARLTATERDAVVLRYFQNKTLAEVGAALGLEERAAQKRVGRALEKLRNFFTKRGVVSTTAIIAAELSTNSIHAVPVALAKLVTAVAVAKGSTATVSTLTLVKGTLKLMTWIKVKFAIGLGVVGLGIGTTLVVAQLATQPRHIQVPNAKEPPTTSGDLLGKGSSCGVESQESGDP